MSFEIKREYAYTVERFGGAKGPLRIIYTADHPASALRNDAGQFVGHWWCAVCAAPSPLGVYFHQGQWKCAACKEAATPRTKRVQKEQSLPFEVPLG